MDPPADIQEDMTHIPQAIDPNADADADTPQLVKEQDKNASVKQDDVVKHGEFKVDGVDLMQQQQQQQVPSSTVSSSEEEVRVAAGTKDPTKDTTGATDVISTENDVVERTSAVSREGTPTADATTENGTKNEENGTAATAANTSSNTATKSNVKENSFTPRIKPAQDVNERSKQFLELRSYEAKRRSIYNSKLKSTLLYWRAFRDMLTRAYEETDRAENLVRGTVAANQSYAEFLMAVAEDRLDYGGKPVDRRRGNKLKDERFRKYHSLGGGAILMGMGIEQSQQQGQPSQQQQHHQGGGGNILNTSASSDSKDVMQHTGSVSLDGLPQDSMLKSFLTSQNEMASAFLDNVSFNKDVILEKMKGLRKELEAEVSVMGALGDATMHELKKAEDDVHKAWSAYYSLAALVDKDIDSPRNQKASPALVKGVDPNAVTDVWLMEMHYRMAVAYLTTVWEKSSKELSNLFAGMKEMECNRRFRLRELMALFMQRTERMWNSIPPLLTPVVEDLTQTPTDTKLIEKDVAEKIRAKAQELQKKDEAILTTDPMNGPGLAGVPEPDENFELQSPLMSDLLCKVEVIWRKSDKMMSVWKPCLAVMTSDSYLHLFEIPPSGNVQTGTPSEVAFQTLVPPVVVPTEEGIVDGAIPPSNGKSWFEHLVPGASLDLKNSVISFDQQKGNSTFEITESMAPSGFSKISKNVRKRKYSLRLSSSQHMVDWLLELRELGAE
eukprot:CAMPEP_0176497290 /NCGR_PEP_ID=MMETSP0200_2-20121128/11643_1 /TAXON_ID=947934 /ORGANISM="Chaetoceros sp., Strain GSL56" /LENGTH=725 /DNA_ID=CAMNT_0017895289 /DNA_START=135 /DNA_END=2312 /DNA_ORIENTATION=+